jgi:UDP-glucuronate decarboxylase
VHPQREDYWGNVNPIGLRSCYDEGKRCAETLFFDYWPPAQAAIKVARIFNTYGPRMHPNDGRVVSNFIVQALRRGPDHRLRRRHRRRAPSATSTTCVEVSCG